LNKAVSIFPKESLFFRGQFKFEKGDFEGAIQDFNEYKKLNDDSLNIYFKRGRALFHSRKFVQALKDFRKATSDELKDTPQMVLWEHLTAIQTNTNSQLASNFFKIEKDKWPAPLAKFFLRKLSREALVKSVANTEERCELNFYLGVFDLIGGQKKRAVEQLKNAKQNCPKGFIEYSSAIAELKILGQ